MNRPACLPVTIKTAVNGNPDLSYSERQRINNSMTARANRSGPVNKLPMPDDPRGFAVIPEHDGRRDVCEYIDAVQCAIVAAQSIPNGDPARLISILANALRLHSWHP